MIRAITSSFAAFRSAAAVSFQRRLSGSLRNTASKTGKAWQRINEKEKKILFDKGKSLTFGDKRYSKMTREERRLVELYSNRIKREENKDIIAILDPGRFKRERAEIKEEKEWQRMEEEEKKILFDRGKSLVFGNKKYSEMTRQEQRLVNFYQDQTLEKAGIFSSNLDPKLAKLEEEKAWKRAWQHMSKKEKGRCNNS